MTPAEPPPGAAAGKAAWRVWARRERAEMAHDARTRAEAEARMREHLLAWPPWREARWALVYLAFGDECDPLAGHGTGAGPRARPRLATTRTPPPGADLSVHAYDPADLEAHAFGFAQPPPGAATVPLDALDVVLVPGLAFDRGGGRLGYGRGLYDRLLAELAPSTVTLGVTRDALLVEALPREAHDVDVGWLLTESGIAPATHGAGAAGHDGD